ncbi:SDR family NAD(P)-dependent oxidoreductase [Rhodoplanes sp. TEM]|uniref:SDR family NAD(P)-dependent oxidoreductase n=1 Tax=Rhodoplanes tepidamans TaxID=200616 RepID=A0ABT5J9Y2_RHOTP|nr:MULTISPECIES: SDR family NAD(P)-dependent oxidoreductase [Rhodoplanes]MDC7786465.1 SDR family NAD(P)-dependent oxidoreductase [Rhodoplanes tepidamans]MDC7985107.1 SDR family NAD(P)-dependent oxidoreductase [Rhodoplanes sp. TEM]MDQ0357350.1 NAD(P)-dependent dehydrogenase (short-subunit alcohol dehydrogenase family) [Rhodoplanes tepidamans]
MAATGTTTGTTAADGSLSGKTVVITGATGGIGLETAVGLARKGARLVLVGRDRARGEAALARLRQLVPGAEAEIDYADLARLDDLRALAARLAARPRVDVLLNNAGGMFARREVTADGLERTFALNHMAYVALTVLLRDTLVRSAPARVVNVASEAHRGATLDLDDLQAARGYGGWPVYRRSKLANILFTRELARRLAGTGVTANCLHPGFVATGFGDNNRGLYGLGIRIAKLFALPLAEGAATSIHVASAPEFDTTTGAYVVRSRLAEPSAAARDDAVARRLWDASLALGGLAWA